MLLTLGTFMDKDGANAYASQATLARGTGLADRTVREHLKAAVDSGWLERTQRGHRRGCVGLASVYRASLPARVRQLEETSTGTPTPVEDDPNRREDGSQPADGSIPTGAGPPPTTREDNVYQVERPLTLSDYACSKIDPPSKAVLKETSKVGVRIVALAKEHDEDAVRLALDEIPTGSLTWASELIDVLKAHLGSGATDPFPARVAGGYMPGHKPNSVTPNPTVNVFDFDENGQAVRIA
ncbi:MAG: helix-turn-helix domain-containing protein [Actinomycetota bacterium]